MESKEKKIENGLRQIEEILREVVKDSRPCKFIQKITEQWEIEESELNELWHQTCDGSVEEEEDVEINYKRLKRMKVSALKEICLEKGFSPKGKKIELIARILDTTTSDLEVLTTKKKKAPSRERVILKKHKKFDEYFWHPATNFLMKDKKTGVIGKISGKEDDQTIIELSENDLVLCQNWGFPVHTE